jgi:maspardin
MKIIAILAIAALVLIGLVVYHYPVSGPGSEALYQAVSPQTVASLKSFRDHYPKMTITHGGDDWNYRVAGSGGKTILFLHGMTGAYDIWWQQISALEDTYRIVTVTYPPIDNLNDLGEGIMAILNTEEIDRVHLVGSSLGGYLSQYLVAHYPQKIEKAIFANTFPPNDIIAEKNKTIGRLLPIIPEWAVMDVLRKNTEAALYPASGHSELVKAYMMEQSYGMMNKQQFVARFHCVIDPFTPPNTEALGIPVMIIEADNDPLVEPALREMLKQTYPAATVATLNQVGHFPYLNQPDHYTELIRAFFQ